MKVSSRLRILMVTSMSASVILSAAPGFAEDPRTQLVLPENAAIATGISGGIDGVGGAIVLGINLVRMHENAGKVANKKSGVVAAQGRANAAVTPSADANTRVAAAEGRMGEAKAQQSNLASLMRTQEQAIAKALAPDTTHVVTTETSVAVGEGVVEEGKVVRDQTETHPTKAPIPEKNLKSLHQLGIEHAQQAGIIAGEQAEINALKAQLTEFSASRTGLATAEGQYAEAVLDYRNTRRFSVGGAVAMTLGVGQIVLAFWHQDPIIANAKNKEIADQQALKDKENGIVHPAVGANGQ